MKTLPAGLQSHLDSGATTLCWCWRLTRQDGVVQGFTDHDNDLSFDGTTFAAATGFAGTEIKETVGLNVDNLDVDGALSSESLSEDDLAAGLYDDATVEIFRVNWQDVSQRILIRKGSIGEVQRGQVAFTAEIRGLTHYLQQPKGRSFQFGCDADLGDGRCMVDLELATYKGSGTVSDITSERLFTVSGLGSFSDDWFSRGLLTWTSGANLGHEMEVKLHANTGGIVTLELWQSMSESVTVGDGFTIIAGCDKQFATCKNKFSNTLNFRGFPHMPGNDFALSYPNSDDSENDGQSRIS